MTSRIYHIGLPKTGTTSIQDIVTGYNWYLGVMPRRNDVRQSRGFRKLTRFLGGSADSPPRNLPDVFFYSEELVLVDSEHGIVFPPKNGYDEK